MEVVPWLPSFQRWKQKDVSCYRPISLISCVSKVFERRLFDHILFICTFLSACSTIWISKKRSAILQLLVFLDRIPEYNDEKELENLSVLYLDFSKAFNTVPHNLIRKMRNFGIGGKLLKLINSYLSGRVQSCQTKQHSFVAAPSNEWSPSGLHTRSPTVSHVYKRLTRFFPSVLATQMTTKSSSEIKKKLMKARKN